MNNYDIAIIGNDILGCTTDLELVRSDASLRVAVVGPFHPWAQPPRRPAR